MIFYIITGILLCILSAFITYKITRSNIQIKQHNADEEYNEQVNSFKSILNDITNQIETATSTKDQLEDNINQLNIQKNNINNFINEANEDLEKLKSDKVNNQAEIARLTGVKETILEHMNELNNQAQVASQNYYNQTMALANKRIEEDIDLAEKQYSIQTEAYKTEYLKCLSDLNEAFQSKTQTKNQELSVLQDKIITANITLDDLTQKISTIIESYRIAELSLSEKEYYRCMISDIDKQEIARLREIEFYMRDKRPICKIIWETYYRTPASALIARLLGDKVKCSGIYKITNLTNNKVYIGQSVNLADRLTTHMKSGVGIDANNNKMYQDMKQNGIENFTFEILEQCETAKLNAQEKYWIEFYHSQEFGYNNTKGGS